MFYEDYSAAGEYLLTKDSKSVKELVLIAECSPSELVAIHMALSLPAKLVLRSVVFNWCPFKNEDVIAFGKEEVVNFVKSMPTILSLKLVKFSEYECGVLNSIPRRTSKSCPSTSIFKKSISNFFLLHKIRQRDCCYLMAERVCTETNVS